MKKGIILNIVVALLVSAVFVSCSEDNSEKKGGGLAADPSYNKEEGKLNKERNPFVKEADKPNVKKIAGPTADMTFPVASHDFGDIKQNEKHTHIFKFKNNSEHPLLIESAKGSCGCTVPKYPKEPIAPGAEGEIEVVFSSGKKKGKQNKSVTIVANTNPVQTKIAIEAMIEVPKEIVESKH